jgi:Flp pilus assembly protein TadD
MTDSARAARRGRHAGNTATSVASDPVTGLVHEERRPSGDADADAVLHLREGAASGARSSAPRVEHAKALMAAGQLEAAAEEAAAAARATQDGSEAWIALGLIRYAQSDLDAAQDAFGRAVACDPANPQANNNLGLVLLQRRQLKSAAEAFLRAIEADPAYAMGCSNLGTVFDVAGDWTTAESWFAEAIRRNGAHVEARHNLAASQMKRGAWRDAVDTLRAILRMAPDDVRALWNLADTQLRLGEFAEGWRLFEHGIGHRDYRGPARARAVLPYTPGARRLLLWGEQGIGEEMMFASMLPDLSAGGASGVVECDHRLVPLFARSFPGWRFAATATPPAAETSGPFDAALPLASMAQHLRGSLARFPRHAGYLRADRARTAALRARYAAGGPEQVVGISWMSAARLDPTHKSIDLRSWGPILRTPGVRFVSLQYGSAGAQIAAAARELGVSILEDAEIDQLRDTDGFAAQVAAMDHVVTVSTTAAHLAGALGRPGTVLLPAARGLKWHWMAERPDCPWYPSLTLLRQGEAGDWDDVIAAAAARLAERRSNP